MLHNVVVHLKNSTILRGHYRADDSSIQPSAIPSDLPISMTIEPENGSPAVTFNLEDAKAVFFVHSFTGSPSQQDVRFFDSLSIHPYLWVRVTFQDGEIMEGRVSNDIDLLIKNAFRLFPVDELTNNRCLFLPKGSLRSFQIIGLLEEQSSQLEVA
ncbi:MAG TPA: hypothetical protein VND66_01190 [Acidobacteriaceae bacterium]|nr:hypothetical protein [Terriglobia bacterium]HVC89210.1 hypothetical protein [Acidobacteriaceae bacterium]